MKLFDATMDLASFAKGTEDYKITRVDWTQNMFECNALSGRVGEFGEGATVWFRTGACAGKMATVQSGMHQMIRLQTVLPEHYAVGDEITVCAVPEFTTQQLINAVNHVLRVYKVMKFSDDLQYDPETRYYELPEGVTNDIRKVILCNSAGGYRVESHYWQAGNGLLSIYDSNAHIGKNDPIQLFYVDYHGAVGEDDEISSQVDPLYLRYMSWLYLCRNLIQGTHKDNLVASDMYNEAKVYERDYSKLPNKALMNKTWTYPQW